MLHLNHHEDVFVNPENENIVGQHPVACLAGRRKIHPCRLVGDYYCRRHLPIKLPDALFAKYLHGNKNIYQRLEKHKSVNN